MMESINIPILKYNILERDDATEIIKRYHNSTKLKLEH
jgi:hypothetical protein